MNGPDRHVHPIFTGCVLTILMGLAVSNRPLNRSLGIVADINLRPDWIGAGVAIGAICIALALGWRLPRSSVVLPIGCFIGVEFLSSALNYRVWPSGPKFSLIYVLGFAYLCAILLWVRDVRMARWLTSALIVIGVGESLYGVLSVLVSDFLGFPVAGATVKRGLGFMAARGTMTEPNLFSSLLLVPFALALWRWGADQTWSWRRALVCSTLVAGLTFGLTRAAWIAGIGTVCVWILRRRPPRLRLGFLALSAIVSTLLFLGFDMGVRRIPVERTGLYDRVVKGVATGRDVMLMGRVTKIRSASPAVEAAPLLGHGAGSVNRMREPRVRRAGGLVRLKYAWIGNALVFLLVEVGVVGLAIALWVLASVARETWGAIGRIRDATLRLDHEALLVGGGAVLLAWQATHGLWQMYGYLYLGALLALTLLAKGEASCETSS